MPFRLFWCNGTQRRAGRPRSSPRRFAAIVGYADRVTVWNINTIHAPFHRRQAPVANIMRMHL
ncbi:MAG: hypothetical protein LBQ66_15055 [Planctomycetaceae bacterium]|nr:hypothetical protein [Planctomycetaceae bacterium]